MDEAERRPPRRRVHRQRAVALVQHIDESRDLLSQSGLGIVVVMEVDFDLAEARAAQRGDLVQVLGPVFLLGIEERVLGMHAVGIAMATR